MWLKWILLCLLSFPAFAYRFTSDFAEETGGFYWASVPITIVVSESDPKRKKLLEDLSKASMDEWEFRTGLSLWDYDAGSPNIIRWSTNFAAETKMDPNSVLAVAIRYANGPYFARTEIVINGNHHLNQDESLLRTTITHELGHTMGLDHSNVNDAVMAPTLQAIYFGLHDDDVKGMSAAHEEMVYRKDTGYVSKHSFKAVETQESKAMSCGTVGIVGHQGIGLNGLVSLIGGILISLIRKVTKKFKSRS